MRLRGRLPPGLEKPVSVEVSKCRLSRARYAGSPRLWLGIALHEVIECCFADSDRPAADADAYCVESAACDQLVDAASADSKPLARLFDRQPGVVAGLHGVVIQIDHRSATQNGHQETQFPHASVAVLLWS